MPISYKFPSWQYTTFTRNFFSWLQGKNSNPPAKKRKFLIPPIFCKQARKNFRKISNEGGGLYIEPFCNVTRDGKSADHLVKKSQKSKTQNSRMTGYCKDQNKKHRRNLWCIGVEGCESCTVGIVYTIIELWYALFRVHNRKPHSNNLISYTLGSARNSMWRYQ